MTSKTELNRTIDALMDTIVYFVHSNLKWEWDLESDWPDDVARHLRKQLRIVIEVQQATALADALTPKDGDDHDNH